MRLLAKSVLIVVAAAGLSGCSAKEDFESSQAAVAQFHRQLNASRFPEIYRNASREIRSEGPVENFTSLLEAIHRKLGNVTGTQSTGWRVNYHSSGSRAILTYRTSFERGTAEETSVFDISSRPPRLAGYNISSKQLIIN